MKTLSAYLAILLASTGIIATAATIDLNRDPPQPQSTICGDIVNANIEYSTSIGEMAAAGNLD